MTASAKTISEYVGVGPRFRRSVHLEKDYVGASPNGDYIVTPTAREALRRLTESFAHSSPYRAWTLTGPYGVGKSAFALFLTRLFCSSDESGQAARSQLEETDPELARELSELDVCGSKVMLPVLVTARRMPASVCIAEGIVSAAASLRSRRVKTNSRHLRGVLNARAQEDAIDSREVVTGLSALTAAARDAGYSGVLLILDELGKLFEYAARYPQNGDVFVLQEVAEQAARSNDFPFIILGLLHQSFEEYGLHLDLATRREWAKIQGRFEDIAFLEPADQVIRMIAKAIRWQAPHFPRGLRSKLKEVIAAAIECGVVPRGMQAAEFEKAALAAYPLHPVTLVALPYLFRRFAQNERSLFSYLSSLEPYGFQDFIRSRPLNVKSPEFVRLSDLFDYFTSNFGLGLYRQPHALRWLETADVLERKDDLSSAHRELVKSIGILNALGEFCHLCATEKTISVAVEDAPSLRRSTRGALRLLKEQSVLTFRKYNKTYRIWEGSDVDIEERIAEGERKVRHALDLAGSVMRYLPSRPLVARRHSFETGALRYFRVSYIDDPDEMEGVYEETGGWDGEVVVCLAESTAITEQFDSRARAAKAAGLSNVLFAIPQQIGELRAAVTQLGALRWAWENTPELRDDRVARREISLRIVEAEQRLVRNLQGLLDPRPVPTGSGCVWFYRGSPVDVYTPSDVSQLLSDVCDKIYSNAPRIRNELIARRSLSSAAAAARRNLIERMLENADKPLLGIEGYPPERSIYDSLLRATGVHTEVELSRWEFRTPNRDKGHNLYPCWQKLYKIVFCPQPEPVPLNEVFSALANPPYGLLDGIHPIILCAFMQVHADEVTLYREGTFIPEPSVADFEVLMRRPELFAIAGSRVAGGRAAVVERLAKSLQVKPATVPVVRALFRMVKGLPDLAWQTRRLSEATIRLRSAFQNAKSPERFLFVEVPQALAFPAFSDRKSSPKKVSAFFDALNSSLQEWASVGPITVQQARDTLLERCGLPLGEAGWQRLREESLHLDGAVTQPQLLAFVHRVLQSDADAAGVESVLAFIANRPPRSWTDADVDRFPAAAALIGNAFRESLAIARKGTRRPLTYESLSRAQREEADAIAHSLRHYLAETSQCSEAVRAALELVLNELTTGGE